MSWCITLVHSDLEHEPGCLDQYNDWEVVLPFQTEKQVQGNPRTTIAATMVMGAMATLTASTETCLF